MPLYEFVCQDCSQPFEELILNSSAHDKLTCPSCGSTTVKKKISTFAAKISGGSRLSLSPSIGSSCSTGST